MLKNDEKNIENSIKYVELDGNGNPIKIIGFCKANDLKKNPKIYEFYWDSDWCKELNIKRIMR